MLTLNTIWSIVIAVFMFGFLIFIHELGHFLAAKKAGIGVVEFSLGMGPRIWKKQGKETLFSLKLFPIGGSCMMVGEDEDIDDERAFNKKGKLARIGVLAAGAGMNLAFGVLLVFIIQCFIPSYVTTTVEDVYLEQQTAFKAGDRIVKCDGYGVLNYTDLNLAINFIEHETFDATVIRNGERVELTDIPLIMTEDGYRIGISFGVADMNFGTVLTQTATESLSIVRSVWKSLVFLVTGRVGIGELSGPVGITAMIGETVQYGVLNVLNLVALIAINLGVMNLLPIPALDGGRILFVLVEAVIGKPIPPEKEGIVHLVGFGLLMVLTVIVFINDIIRVVT